MISQPAIKSIAIFLLSATLLNTAFLPLTVQAALSPQEKEILLTGAISAGVIAAGQALPCVLPASAAPYIAGAGLGGLIGLIAGAVGGDNRARLIGTGVGVATGAIIAFLAATLAKEGIATAITVPINRFLSELTSKESQKNLSIVGCLRAGSLKTMETMALQVLLRAVAVQIVTWIQDERNSGFVDNFARQAGRTMDEFGGAFLNEQLEHIDLCGNIYGFLNVALQIPPLVPRFACTVTDIVRNVGSFYRNWENGGWAAFLRINIVPKNNPYGALLLALDTTLGKQATEVDRLRTGFLAGKGFLGFNVKKPRDCFDPGVGTELDIQPLRSELTILQAQLKQVDTEIEVLQRKFEASRNEKDRTRVQEAIDRKTQLENRIKELEKELGRQQEELGKHIVESTKEAHKKGRAGVTLFENEEGHKNLLCDFEYVTKTPGDLFSGFLKKAEFLDIEFAVIREEFNQAMASIIQAAVGRLIRESSFVARGGGAGVFSGGTGSIRGPMIGPDGRIVYEDIPFGAGAISGGGVLGVPPHGTDLGKLEEETQRISQNLVLFNAKRPVLEGYSALNETVSKLISVKKRVSEKHSQIDERFLQKENATLTQSEFQTNIKPLAEDLKKLELTLETRINLQKDLLGSQKESHTLLTEALKGTIEIIDQIDRTSQRWSQKLQEIDQKEINLVVTQGVELTDTVVITDVLSNTPPPAPDTRMAIFTLRDLEKTRLDRNLEFTDLLLAEMDRLTSKGPRKTCILLDEDDVIRFLTNEGETRCIDREAVLITLKPAPLIMPEAGRLFSRVNNYATQLRDSRRELDIISQEIELAGTPEAIKKAGERLTSFVKAGLELSATGVEAISETIKAIRSLYVFP